jgi:hypothetical protein
MGNILSQYKTSVCKKLNSYLSFKLISRRILELKKGLFLVVPKVAVIKYKFNLEAKEEMSCFCIETRRVNEQREDK